SPPQRPRPPAMVAAAPARRSTPRTAGSAADNSPRPAKVRTTPHSQNCDTYGAPTPTNRRNIERSPRLRPGASGADDGIRTRDPHLGKVMLYQLSHVRVGGPP